MRGACSLLSVFKFCIVLHNNTIQRKKIISRWVIFYPVTQGNSSKHDKYDACHGINMAIFVNSYGSNFTEVVKYFLKTLKKK